MTKKNKHAKYAHAHLYIILAAALLVSVLIIGWAAYQARPPKVKYPYPATDSVMPHVDGTQATAQVTNFYQQYTNLRNIERVPDFHKKLVAAYGNSALEFYYQYYQHGFDPIVCSNLMPNKVTASLASTGPVATVDAVMEYPDGSKATVVAKVILEDKLAIESITCPGNKGNLPPAGAQ